jgi:hypothetical protein
MGQSDEQTDEQTNRKADMVSAKIVLSISCFIVALCILIYVEFTHQQMHFFYFKKHIKIDI